MNTTTIEPGDQIAPDFGITSKTAHDEETRWVWFAGDVIAKERKEEVERLRTGGVEVTGECLELTQGFIRRARFVPVSLAITGESREILGQAGGGLGYLHRKEGISTLLAVQNMPGRQIGQIVGTQMMGHDLKAKPIGIVEITGLRGLQIKDFATTGLQTRLLPAYPTLAKPLSAIEQQIQQADIGTDPTIQQIQEQLLTSCRQFRLFAEYFVAAQTELVRLGVSPAGFSHTYNGIALTLFDQLPELRRVDDHLRDQQNAAATMANTQDKIAQALTALAAGNGSAKADVNDLVLAQLKEMQVRLDATERKYTELLVTKGTPAQQVTQRRQ